tara:strand:+ start:433 stop:612 length:180 start_codon:yes stop_codon:yes gene_type:complete
MPTKDNIIRTTIGVEPLSNFLVNKVTNTNDKRKISPIRIIDCPFKKMPDIRPKKKDSNR